MLIKEITFIPETDPEKSKMLYKIIDEEGNEKIIEGLSGLFIGAVTDMDFYMGTQGNIMSTFNFIASELEDTESFLSELFYSSLAAVIQGAKPEILEKIYYNLSVLMEFIGERQEAITEGGKEEIKE